MGAGGVDDVAELVLGVEPAPGEHDDRASVTPIVALCRAGALGVIDLVTAGTTKPFGVQPGRHVADARDEFVALLPPQVTTVVIDVSTAADLAGLTALEAAIRSCCGRAVLVEVTSQQEGQRAVAAGATG